MQSVTCIEAGRAASYLSRVNREIVKAAAARRQRLGFGEGARPPASLAAAPVALHELSESGLAGVERVTPLGYQTARRQLPQVLERLAASDPRRRAAEMLASAYERLGSIRGQDMAGADSKGGLSDGGATTRVKHAARVRLVEALANGWAVDRGKIAPRQLGRALLTPGRNRGQRQQIMAFPTLVAVCVEGRGVYDILRAHGWSAQSFNGRRLAAAILQALDDVADGLGLGRGGCSNSVDSG